MKIKIVDMDDLISALMQYYGGFYPAAFDEFYQTYGPFSIRLDEPDWLIWDKWGAEVLRDMSQIMGGVVVARSLEDEKVYIVPQSQFPVD